MNNDAKKPDGEGPPKDGKIDWAYQIKYTLFLLVAIVAVLLLMRFFGLRS